MMTFRRDRAFSLVELLMVIAIIGILSSLTIISLRGAGTKARDTKVKSNAAVVDKALAQFEIDNSQKFPLFTLQTDTTNLTSALVPNYVRTASSLTPASGKSAKYISSANQTSYAQAWELENMSETAVTTGNGIYTTTSSGVNGVVTAGKSVGSAPNFMVNGVVTINNVSAYNSNTFSVSVWVNPSSLSGTRTIIEKWVSGSRGWRITANSNGSITFTSINVLGLLPVANATTGVNILKTGTWTHIVATFDFSTQTTGLKLYVADSGATMSTANATGASSYSNINTYNSTYTMSSSSTGFIGAIDDVRLYNIELNSVVIATIHDNNGNRQGQYINNSEPNLVGAWRLDEGRTINTPCLTGSDAILCDVMGETTPLAAVTAVNNVLLAGFSPPPTAGSWTTGIVPLGLTWTSTLVNGKAFVTYR